MERHTLVQRDTQHPSQEKRFGKAVRFGNKDMLQSLLVVRGNMDRLGGRKFERVAASSGRYILRQAHRT